MSISIQLFAHFSNDSIIIYRMIYVTENFHNRKIQISLHAAIDQTRNKCSTRFTI